MKGAEEEFVPEDEVEEGLAAIKKLREKLKKAVEEKFKVNVLKVSTISLAGKEKQIRTRTKVAKVANKPFKKAVVTLKEGMNIIEFTPTESGSIPWSCWMGMIQGTFIVKDNIDITKSVELNQELAKVNIPKARGCGCGG